jgi:4-amino-4-deoxy-L-arabinose transferase-like glycosyltransferase
MSRRSTIIGILGLMALRMLVAGWFAAMTPLWENFDEVNHYYVAQYRGGIDDARPQMDWSNEYQIFNQFSQPPLYHLLVGLLIRPFSEPIPSPTGNPTPYCPNPQPNNFFTHHIDAETPFAQSYRGIWLARSITILVGAISVAGVWIAARILWSHAPRRAWLAALLYALFSPATALSSWFNNDAPLMLIGVIVLILLALILRSGISRRIAIGIIAAFMVGIGIKINTIALLPAIFLVTLDRIVFQNPRARLRRLSLLFASFSLLLVLFVGVNFGLCGLLLCRTHRALTVENFSVLTNPIINQYTVPSLRQLLETLSAPSANPAYSAPDWVSLIVPIILCVGFVSAGLATIEDSRERKPLILLLVIICSAGALGLVRVWWLGVAFLPARYIAVAFPSLILTVAAGYDFLAVRLHRAMIWLPVIVFVAISSIAIQSSYAPLWQMPQRLNQLPTSAIPVDIHFENGLQVAAYTLEGDVIHLYFSTDAPIHAPLAVEISMIDGAGQSITHCEMLAGSPIWSTAEWRAGEYVLQSAELAGLGSILDTVYVRIRVMMLNDAIFVNTIPDYEREVPALSGQNRITVEAD